MSERRNWRWMAEFNIHSWFGEHSHWSRVGQRVIRGSSPVSVSASNGPSNAGDATFSATEGTDRTKRPDPLQLVWLYHEKLLYSRTSDREKNTNFCAVPSGDNKGADIMQQQPRLVARRRVDSVFVQLDALCPGQKSKVESPRNLRPHLPYLHFAFSTLVGYTIYASGEIGLSCFLGITIHKTPARSLDIYPHSTSFDSFSVYGTAHNVRSQELALWQATPSNSARC